MSQAIFLATLVVDDYDAALRFYVGALGFSLVEDTPQDGSRRWVVVRPPGGRESGLLLARAEDAAQRAAIGRQTGGRVAFFLRTDDFWRDHMGFSARGVRFLEAARHEPYGWVAVFEDPYGTRWDLIGPRTGPAVAVMPPAVGD